VTTRAHLRHLINGRGGLAVAARALDVDPRHLDGVLEGWRRPSPALRTAIADYLQRDRGELFPEFREIDRAIDEALARRQHGLTPAAIERARILLLGGDS
jgi:hypothetical protein